MSLPIVCLATCVMGVDGCGTGTTLLAAYNVHANHLGSVALVTDDSPLGIAQRSFLRPFGETHDQQPSLVENFPSHSFTGHELDHESGLYYARGRYYDPTLGRFVSPDPALNDGTDSFERLDSRPQALNAYSYVENRPTVLVDPTGEALVAVVLLFVGEELLFGIGWQTVTRAAENYRNTGLNYGGYLVYGDLGTYGIVADAVVEGSDSLGRSVGGFLLPVFTPPGSKLSDQGIFVGDWLGMTVEDWIVQEMYPGEGPVRIDPVMGAAILDIFYRDGRSAEITMDDLERLYQLDPLVNVGVSVASGVGAVFSAADQYIGTPVGNAIFDYGVLPFANTFYRPYREAAQGLYGPRFGSHELYEALGIGGGTAARP